MKKSISAAAIFMLVAISFSSVYAENGDPSTSVPTLNTQQQVQHTPGNGHQSMGMMGGQMQEGMSKCMSATMDGGKNNHTGAHASNAKVSPNHSTSHKM